MKKAIDRRTLLKQLVLLSGTVAIHPLFFSSCQSKKEGNSPKSINGTIDIEPFSSIEELRNYLRLSPDNLVAKANRYVKAKEIEELFLLVRDEIMTYPDQNAGYSLFSSNATSVRWGTKATLRGGAGTLREKADLLVELYQKAGFEAKVLGWRNDLSIKKQEEILFRTIERNFEPPFPSDFTDKMGHSDQQFPSIDIDGKESKVLAKKLLEQVPEEYEKEIQSTPFKAGDITVPCVQVKTAEREYFLNLIDFEHSFSDSPSTQPSEVSKIYDSVEYDTVQLSLKGVFNDLPEEAEELLQYEIPINELAGRHLSLSFMNGLPLERLFTTKVQDISLFTPVCSLQGLDIDEESNKKYTKKGLAYTVQGDRVEITANGQLRVNDTEFGAAESKSGKADQVEKLEAVAYPEEFPNIQIRLKAFDKNGAPIEGLMPGDFSLEEDRQARQAFLQSNQFAPKILILRDWSGSVPADYLGNKWTKLYEHIQTQIKAKYPQAQISVVKTSDRYWEELHKVSGKGWNMIICVSDGELIGEFKEEYAASLKALPPVVFTYVLQNEHEDLSKLAEYIDVTPVQAENWSLLNQKLEAALPEKTIPPYTFSYTALTEGNPKRLLKIGLGKSQKLQLEYKVPSSPALPSRHLCGLFLEIKSHNRSHRHHLGGYQTSIDREITQAHFEEARNVLFGTTSLFVEGARPMESVWLDDIWTSRLSFLDTYQACEAGQDIPSIEKKLSAVRNIPATPFLLLSPLENQVSSNHLIYEQSCRMCLLQHYPDFKKGDFKTKANILDFTDFKTIAATPKKAFQITLENTARMAVAENALYNVSTQSLLKEEALVNFDKIYYLPEEYPSISSDRQSEWYQYISATSSSSYDYAIGPKSGATFAYYKIDKRTGAMLGVLSDGSGGGAEEKRIKAILQELDQAIAAINLMIAGIQAGGGLSGGSAASLGIVAVYGQYLARLYGCVALALSYMNTDKLEARIRATLSRMICDMIKGLAYGYFKPALANFENIVSMGGGSLPSPCDAFTPKPDFER